MQIDLTKPRPIHVLIGLHLEDYTIGFINKWSMKMFPLTVSIVNIRDMTFKNVNPK